MNTPEELKSQTKAKSEPEEYGPDDFSGSVQRTQLKAEGPPDMKNKAKAVEQPGYISLERPTVREMETRHRYQLQ